MSKTLSEMLLNTLRNYPRPDFMLHKKDGRYVPVSTDEFVRGLRLFYRPFDWQYGLIKSASFGFTITLIGCYLGLSTRGGAEGVGSATTRTVVYSAAMILVLDAYWAVTLLRAG